MFMLDDLIEIQVDNVSRRSFLMDFVNEGVQGVSDIVIVVVVNRPSYLLITLVVAVVHFNIKRQAKDN